MALFLIQGDPYESIFGVPTIKKWRPEKNVAKNVRNYKTTTGGPKNVLSKMKKGKVVQNCRHSQH